MRNINILVVEDDERTIESWMSAISLNNVTAQDNGFTFYAEYTKNLVSAELKLNSFEFDAAIIDLRLENLSEEDEHHKNADGNDVLKRILSSKICLVAIYTGQSIDVDLSPEQQRYISIFDKGEVVPKNILAWINEQKKLVTTISVLKNVFSSSMSELFYKSIWPRWMHWLESERDEQFTQKALKRHMATHLHAKFFNEGEDAHPEEYYFIPPLTTELDTGDITFVNNKSYIHITPRCEIATGKNKTFQFVELADISTEFSESLKVISNVASTVKQIGDAKSKLSQLIKNGGNKASLHFLPKIKKVDGSILGPFHAQFDRLIFIPAAELALVQDFQDGVYASLSNEFLPSLVERLGSHFSRIGTPDYSHQ